MLTKVNAISKRLASLFTISLLLLSSMSVGVGGLVLCYGADGHVAIESNVRGGWAELGHHSSPRVPQSGDAAQVELYAHHILPCVDQALTITPTRGEVKIVQTKITPQDLTTVSRSDYSSFSAPTNVFPELYRGSDVNPTLRALRTVILLT